MVEEGLGRSVGHGGESLESTGEVFGSGLLRGDISQQVHEVGTGVPGTGWG